MDKESAITKYMDVCLICGAPREAIHHGIEGTANRAKSDKWKLIMPLCARHHNMSDMSVHGNREMQVMSHVISQLAFEREYFRSRVVASKSEKDQMDEDVRALFIKEFGMAFV